MTRCSSCRARVAAALAAAGALFLALLAPAAPPPLSPPANGPQRSLGSHHALVGGTVHTGPGTTIERGAVVLRDGLIVEVVDLGPAGAGGDGAGGQNGWTPPAGADAWDCTGQHIYPGLIDPFVEADAPEPPGDAPGMHWSARVLPQRSVLDGTGLDDATRDALRAMGFVAAGLAPKGGQVFRGRGGVVSLAKPMPDPSLPRPPVYRPDAFQVIALRAGGGGGGGEGRWPGYPGSEMGAIALIRQTLMDSAWLEGTRRAGAVPPGALDALAGPEPLLLDAADELQVLRGAKLAREARRRLIAVGSGTEFRRLGALAGLEPRPALVLPLNYPETPKVASVGEAESVPLRELMTWEQAPTNPRRIDAAFGGGRSVSLTTARLKDRASFRERLRTAGRHGLSEERALAMLTVNPAEALGVGDRLGTIAPGRVASVVVMDGPLLGERTKVMDVWVDGQRHEVTPRRATLEGTWEVTTDPPPADGGRISYTISRDNDITITKVTPGPDGAEQVKTTRARSVRLERNRLSFAFDHEPFGETGVFVTSAIVQGDTMVADAVRTGGQRFRWTARRLPPNPVLGTWRVVEADGVPKQPDDPDGLTIEFAERTVTLRFRDREGEETVVRSEDVSYGPGSATFTHELAKLGGAGVANDTVTLAEGELRGESVLPDGARHTYRMRRADTDADRDRRLALRLEGIPERLPTPFGPYGLPELPPQDTVLITNATVWTCGPQGVLAPGWVLVRAGRIEAVGGGAAPAAPESASVIDGTGMHLTPGLIDCHSHTGISGGVNEAGQAVTAEVRIEDVTDPDAMSWYWQLAGGVTAVNSLHGSANPIGGQSCTNKVRWGVAHPDDMHFEGALPGIKFALGENVKQSNWGERNTTRYPQTRMGVETLIRDRFEAARAYGQLLRTGNPVRRDLELEALAEVLDGRRLVHCHSYRQDEILMLCRVAGEFGFKLGTFQHILEGYKVADEVREHARGASAFSDWWAYKVEVQDAIPQAGPIMHEQGVCVSYNSDSDELARRMNLEAAKAVKYGAGLAPEEALLFVTLNPAKQLAVEGRTGSIEPGKDADLALWTGPPLSTASRCEMTWVDGRQLFARARDESMRAEAAAERQRIIQKILALDGGGGPTEGGGEGRRPGRGRRPGDGAHDGHAHGGVSDARRERYLDMLRRGIDPESARRGECGCEETE